MFEESGEPSGANILRFLKCFSRKALELKNCTMILLISLLACSSGSPVYELMEMATTTVPTLSATVIGSKEVVFDTREGCEEIDIPDAPARAFRDYQSIVHLVATHYVARASIGPNLNQVRRDCRVIYRSPQDPDPSHFQDNNWLFSFYSEDGRRIAALVHSEYDGEEIPGMCATPKDTNNCWWNTVTFAESRDGGYTFVVPKPPGNLVAALPYPYIIGNRESAYGYHGPTNILKNDGLYYALINDWPYKAQKFGPCLIRTADLFDTRSWRAWDGKDYTIRFSDPYRERVTQPEEHVCPPVLAGTAESLVRNTARGVFIVTQYAPDNVFGPAGFYLQGSRDLKHWSQPALIAKVTDLRATDGPGKWTYEYGSLIDPSSDDRNYSTVGDTPYFYYVRLDGTHPPYSRILFRRQIQLQFGR
jgi:hypothetical protein